MSALCLRRSLWQHMEISEGNHNGLSHLATQTMGIPGQDTRGWGRVGADLGSWMVGVRNL